MSAGVALKRFNFISPAFKHWELVSSLTWRQINTRYRGSQLGLVWAVIIPLMLLAVYTFVFSVVFSARWSVYLQDKTNFALFLFAGLCAHQMLAECISRAPALLPENKSYVKKIRFPLEILSIISILTAMFGLAINIVMLLLLYVAMFGIPPATVLLLPLALLPLILMSLGVSWLISALAVFWRDLRHMTNIVVLLFLFLTPIFYPIQAVPSSYAIYIRLNPMATIVDMIRQLVFFGDLPSFTEWLLLTGLTTLFAAFGYWTFKRMSGAFADVI